MENVNYLVFDKSVEENAADTLTIQFSLDDNHIAVGCDDGVIRVCMSSTGRVMRNLNCRATSEPFSISSIKWRPSLGMTQNVLFATSNDGGVTHWHATSGKLINSFRLDTQVLCSDIPAEGTAFAIGCNDMSVKIYDEATKQLLNTFEPGRGNRLGHSNRIFCVKWIDQNSLISGGWDSNVILWDLRSRKAAGNVFGPIVGGDSVDYFNNGIHIGSYDIKDQISLWDIRNFDKIKSLSFSGEERKCKVYSLQLNKFEDKKYLVAGCTGNAHLLCFSLNNLEMVGEVSNCSGVFCIDFCHNSNKIAAATTDHHVGFYNIVDHNLDSLDN